MLRPRSVRFVPKRDLAFVQSPGCRGGHLHARIKVSAVTVPVPIFTNCDCLNPNLFNNATITLDAIVGFKPMTASGYC